MADPATYREAVGDFSARPGHGWAGLPFFAGTAQALAERLDEKRQAGAVICPPPEQVFAALRATPRWPTSGPSFSGRIPTRRLATPMASPFPSQAAAPYQDH